MSKPKRSKVSNQVGARLLLMAERARGLAAESDPHVADLFLAHASNCEGEANRVVTTLTSAEAR